MTAAFLAVLDSLSALPSSGVLTLHDYDGTLVKTLRLWAGSRNLPVTRRVLDLPERTWDCFEVQVGTMRVVVHDEGSRRVVGQWRPYEPGMEGQT